MLEFKVSGFSIAENQPPKPKANRNLYSVEGIHWDDDDLKITLRDSDNEVNILFEAPISFRSQDECDMLEYWNSRGSENMDVATIYTIEKSPYLDFIREGISGMMFPELRLWLIAGIHQCVEVVCRVEDFPSIKCMDAGNPV